MSVESPIADHCTRFAAESVYPPTRKSPITPICRNFGLAVDVKWSAKFASAPIVTDWTGFTKFVKITFDPYRTASQRPVEAVA
jgi:hypothetical protein